jgi:hypothetical protein
MPLLTTWTGSGTKTYAWTTTSVANGSYTLSAIATDTSGNTTTANRLVVVNNSGVDSTLPAVAIQTPVAGQSFVGSVPITVIASDNVAIALVEVYADGVLILSASPRVDNTYTVIWNLEGVTAGTKTITATAIDTSGNSANASVSIVVEEPNPGEEYFYTMIVRDPRGNNPTVYNMIGDIVDFNYLDRNGSGDCLEGEIEILTSSFAIEALSIITVSVNGVNVYSGKAVIPGAPKSKRESAVKLVGMSSDFDEIKIENLYSTGSTLLEMVRAVVSNPANLPNGVRYNVGKVTAGAGVDLARRDHKRETLRAFLDAMKGYLPGVEYGVDADRDFFFRIPSGTLDVSENSRNIIAFENVDGNGIYDAVEIVFSDGSGGDEVVYTESYYIEPVYYRYQDPVYPKYNRTKEIALPLAGFTDRLAPLGSSGNFNWGTPGNPAERGFDQDILTYTNNQARGSGGIEPYTRYRLDLPVTTDLVYFDIDYALREGVGDYAARLFVVPTGSPTPILHSYIPLPPTLRGIVPFVFPRYSLADFGVPIASAYLAIDLLEDVTTANDDIRIYEITPYKLNTTILSDYAKTEIKLPSIDAPMIETLNRVRTPRPIVNLTTLEYGVLVRKGARYRTILTKDRFSTEVYLEQLLPADVALYKSRLDKRKTQATNDAIRWGFV